MLKEQTIFCCVQKNYYLTFMTRLKFCEDVNHNEILELMSQAEFGWKNIEKALNSYEIKGKKRYINKALKNTRYILQTTNSQY